MIISSRQISDALQKSILDHDNASTVVKKLLEYLKLNNLIHLLPNILRHLEQSEDQRSKLNTVFIKSPFDLSEGVLKKIKHYTESWKAEKYVVEIDKSIIGGVVIQGKNNHIDASIKQNLKYLKELLLK